MDSYKPKRGDAPLQTYKPWGGTQWGIGLIPISLFLVINVAGIIRVFLENGSIPLWVALIYVFVIWGFMISLRQCHLAIYEDGLECRIGNSRSFSTWEDMRRFESRGKNRNLGIYTIRLEKRQESSAFENLMLGAKMEDFIPFLVRVPARWNGCWTDQVVDTDKFATTELGRTLLHYAPQLFEDAEEKAKNG